jgi:two-component system, NtrC family, sensor histidine kinase HydH
MSLTRRDKYYIAFIASLTIFISYLHYSTAPSVRSSHGIYAELYYIPALIGSIFFGLRGAIGALILISLMYVPYLSLTISGPQLLERLLSLFFVGLFSALTGVLIDRERKYRAQLQKDRYLAGLGRVSTNIAHDLKNPLMTIIGFANRLKTNKSDCEEAVEAIADSAANMQQIVYDVLDFAKPVQLELQEQDVRDIVKHSCETCRIKAEEMGATISLKMPQESVKAMIDPFRFGRALSNLISNAIEASGDGHKVSVGLVAGKKYISIRISDNGSGMDAETIENIFVPFYTRKTSGTGLGMSIAKKIIDGHKGKIRINSAPGKGTKVEILLPHSSDAEKGSSPP